MGEKKTGGDMCVRVPIALDECMAVVKITMKAVSPCLVSHFQRTNLYSC